MTQHVMLDELRISVSGWVFTGFLGVSVPSESLLLGHTLTGTTSSEAEIVWILCEANFKLYRTSAGVC